MNNKLQEPCDLIQQTNQSIEKSKNNLATAGYYIDIVLTKTSGNVSLTNTILSKLFTELKIKRSQIERAIEQGDLDYIQKEIHKLHGVFSFCGFTELQQAAKALETCLLVSNSEQLSIQLTTLTEKIDHFLSLEDNLFALIDNKPTAG